MDINIKSIIEKHLAFAKKYQTETMYLWSDDHELYFKHEPNKSPVKKVPTHQEEHPVSEDHPQWIWACNHMIEVTKEVYEASPEYPPDIYWAKP